ncbi:hypothetical protein A3C89_01525 [Candidatus Kaiserbacteria bacterium RIFCSPHIGHO2_02_FULL_50_50]|uniref:Yip1 domain-containing protein n=1 Tax=Candidatus Kaiserbacteria bacterium RIFCSPHIGHO2_02_FULL_50_50 TaxID=1798492 RepID=A0A1F6DCK5_9BACT|nr:MAG: hypothetical protein A3C89_01525 [Candidatus Kaiserbacteria bacterium RIFCSPHIGHO2_02_FULL_50_50]OGG89322.1 MAG: hypothetical protein A3G62_01600 [Candidatus Kaiserbacteria bacterium RIFCSPLOWO2_12_FULL_50_10]
MYARIITLLLAGMPTLALAAAAPTYKQLVAKAASILQATVAVIFWIIFFYVAWVVVQSWALHGDDPKAVSSGKSTLLAGLLGLVILGSLWGLVAFVRSLLLG